MQQLQAKIHEKGKNLKFKTTPAVEQELAFIDKFTQEAFGLTCSHNVLCQRAITCYGQYLRNMILRNRNKPAKFEILCQYEKDELFHVANRYDRGRFRGNK